MTGALRRPDGGRVSEMIGSVRGRRRRGWRGGDGMRRREGDVDLREMAHEKKTARAQSRA